jgi:heme/copper-type cytochrome/quinol oxidase subunit 3
MQDQLGAHTLIEALLITIVAQTLLGNSNNSSSAPSPTDSTMLDMALYYMSACLSFALLISSYTMQVIIITWINKQPSSMLRSAIAQNGACFL